ncbi:hypothetical protein AKJ16_DCAP15575 [Drosera capensis]
MTGSPLSTYMSKKEKLNYGSPTSLGPISLIFREGVDTQRSLLLSRESGATLRQFIDRGNGTFSDGAKH